jgi:ubiquitin-protein ligase E3 A
MLLWEAIHELPVELKKKFLFFSTGSDRVPIKGLGNLNFVISRCGADEERLPSAHTCFNHLLLPEYKTKEKLKAQLLKAISDTEGFHII